MWVIKWWPTPPHPRRCITPTKAAFYSWEDYEHVGNLGVSNEELGPQDALTEELSTGNNELLVSTEDEAGNVLAIVRNIDDQVIGAWLFLKGEPT